MPRIHPVHSEYSVPHVLDRVSTFRQIGDRIPSSMFLLITLALPRPLIYIFRWKFQRTILGDGNFKQDHLALKNDSDDVPLNDGLAYMVARKRFEDYIASAPTIKQPVSNESFCCLCRHSVNVFQASTCHDYRAVSQENHSKAHLDATGIGAIACGRHGCFYPNCVVNFKKGEG